jgi:hypothetical protein
MWDGEQQNLRVEDTAHNDERKRFLTFLSLGSAFTHVITRNQSGCCERPHRKTSPIFTLLLAEKIANRFAMIKSLILQITDTLEPNLQLYKENIFMYTRTMDLHFIASRLPDSLREPKTPCPRKYLRWKRAEA